MKSIAVFGAGGLGREILVLLMQINHAEMQWDILGFYDDNKIGETIHGFPVIGGMKELNNTSEPISIVVAVGNPQSKEKIISAIKNPLVDFPILIHPSVELLPFQQIKIGEGSVITAGNILTTDIKIGKHILLNLDCTIGHDVVIGDYSAIMPGVNISGLVEIGKSAYIGTGASIKHDVKIGDNVTIGAGAVVIESIENEMTVMGNPARLKVKKELL
ncbi:MAG: acetyltransferase [Bacteroidetes bacterium]|nr:acetyltransferase [Bacteroidota bacterium]